MTAKPLLERFWSRVNKRGPVPQHRPRLGRCWLFEGPRNPKGYGKIGSGGRGGAILYTHRLSWVIEHGPLSAGEQVLHQCDNPPCVRPSHLFKGTPRDNLADMWSKGRGSQGPRHAMRKRPDLYAGERHPRAKLSDEQVRRIRKLGATKRYTAAELGRRFRCSASHIYQLLLGRSRKQAGTS